MKVFYISSHGFGHLTRSLALIEKELKINKQEIYIACGKSQIDFAKVYLSKYSDRIIYSIIKSDVGLINKNNSLNIDKDLMITEINKFIKSIDKTVDNEINNLNKFDFDEIYIDISPVGILVGNRLKKRKILISNFSWYNQYTYLNMPDNILRFYKELDESCDEYWRYPLYLDDKHFECVKKDIPFTSRLIDYNKVNCLKDRYGQSLFISCGKSVNLNEIYIKNFKGTIFKTKGIEVKSDSLVVDLPLNCLDTHNYVAASDYIIAKAGWGTIAEAYNGETKMLLLNRASVLEDTENINKLEKMNLAKGVNYEELIKIDFCKLKIIYDKLDTKKSCRY